MNRQRRDCVDTELSLFVAFVCWLSPSLCTHCFGREMAPKCAAVIGFAHDEFGCLCPAMNSSYLF